MASDRALERETFGQPGAERVVVFEPDHQGSAYVILDPGWHVDVRRFE